MLAHLLQQHLGRKISIVDVGALAIDGEPPYQTMVGLCEVIGFDPQDRYRQYGITHLPFVIGDGSEATLYVCAAPGMTSLFEPDPESFKMLGLEPCGEVITEKKVATHRLDSLVRVIDFLKIDAQGSELAAINGAGRLMDKAVFAQIEWSFLPLYKGAPEFWQVDKRLRDLGFVPYMLNHEHRRGKQTMAIDLIYIKDPRYLEEMASAQIVAMAAIADGCFDADDLVRHCMAEIKRRGLLQDAA